MNGNSEKDGYARTNDKQTDVLKTKNRSKNVSRETLGKKTNYKSEKIRFEKELERKNRLERIRKSGGVVDDNPYDFQNPTVRELYDAFRRNELNAIESFYNALYLRANDNYYASAMSVKNKYKNVYDHPASWYKDNKDGKIYTHNKWWIAVKLLESVPHALEKMGQVAEKSRELQKMFLGMFEHSRVSAKKAASLVGALLMIAGSAAMLEFWSQTAEERKEKLIPALQLYVNGEFVGNVESIDAVEKAKNRTENEVSLELGRRYELDCEMKYVPAMVASDELLHHNKLDMLFDKTAVGDNLKYGYGVYSSGVLICVSEDKELIDGVLDENLNFRRGLLFEDGEIEKVSFYNLVVREGRFPDEMFSDENTVRAIFSLPLRKEEEAAGETEETHDDSNVEGEANGSLNVSHSVTMLGGTVGSISDVLATGEAEEGVHSINIELVTSKVETVVETVPYTVEFEYDNTLREDFTRVVKKGAVGSKNVVYLVDYVDNLEVKRVEMSSNVIKEAVSERVIMGTRPLTDDEKRSKSTGKYIYPSQGSLSSGYSWRVLGGYNEFHKGIDIRADAGLDLVAADGGEVIQAEDRRNGYGLCVMIQHDDGTITRYAHCSKLLVSNGDRVAQGQKIGLMGATGRASGVHLHFEVIKDGKTVNPMNYLEPREND